MSSYQNIQNHQFKITTAERRASAVVGSVGRSGLYVPQDFIPSRNINDTLDDDDDGDDETITEGTFIPGSVLSNNSNLSSLSVSKRVSNAELLSEEARLLAASKVPIRRTSVMPTPSSSSSGYGSTTIPGAESDPNLINKDPEAIVESWDEAVREHKIQTTYSLEFQSLFYSSIPLIITFLLQNSLSVASVFSVGHIGSEELAAVTLGSMSCNITGMSLISGLASSLDTFLPQAYGAKKYKQVGMIFQRCTALILTIMFVVCLSWWFGASYVLNKVLPDPESAYLATQYLKVVSFGIPGYVLFETGKRFLQAQGIFHASTYVLFICAPLNAFMNYFFVWSPKFGLGYIGAPISVSINYWLMAIGLLVYTAFTKSEANPLKCWNGLSIAKSFQNWGDLLALALPSVIMIEAEFLAFEILTLLASYLGTTALASQSVVTTMASLSYQVPFAVSIAASTRIANFLGAGLAKSAAMCARMVFILTIVVGALNVSFFLIGRNTIPTWFTNDTAVMDTVALLLPLIALIQVFDALNATSAGCLRGQGLQKIGGYVNIASYYIVGVPMSLALAFWTDLGLYGLWIGTGVALMIIGVVQTYYVLNANWNKLVEEAAERSNSD